MNPIRECRPMFCAATEGAVFLCIMEAVSLKKLLDGEKDAIQLFANNFRTHGFCFYKDGHSFVREAKELEAFFEKPEEEKAKFKHPKIPLLGYSKVSGLNEDGTDGNVFKEKLSFVVGNHELAKNNVYPTESLAAVIEDLQQMSRKLVEVTCKSVYGVESPSDVSVPFFKDDDSSFALFDCAFYLNKSSTGVPPINCAAHYDPGLFAFSVYSNMPGLQVQLQNETKEFVDVPYGEGLGVVWAGDASFKIAKVPRGMHRVLYPKEMGKQSRLTFWLELGTPSQLDTILGKNATSDMPINIFPELDKEVSINSKSPSKPPSKSKVIPYERKRGVPMSKSMIHILEQPVDQKTNSSHRNRRSPSPTNKKNSERKTGVPMSKKRVMSPKRLTNDSKFGELDSGVPMSKVIFPSDFGSENLFGVPESKVEPEMDFEDLTGVPATKSEQKLERGENIEDLTAKKGEGEEEPSLFGKILKRLSGHN